MSADGENAAVNNGYGIISKVNGIIVIFTVGDSFLVGIKCKHGNTFMGIEGE